MHRRTGCAGTIPASECSWDKQNFTGTFVQREMRARGMRSEEGVRSEIRALGRGELLRPGGAGDAAGALLDAAEPCPILSDEWHLLDDVPGPDTALLDLDLRPDGRQVGAG